MELKKNKIIAIGDIHGKLGRLKKLFWKLSFEKEDTIVFLGDYIDRGKNSKGVIDFIINLKDKCNVVTLKGNHEEFAMDTMKYPYCKMGMSWMQNGGIDCLKSYSKDPDLAARVKVMEECHGDFFKNLQICYETESHIFVHGFLAHELDVDDQEEYMCLWGRFGDIWPHKSGKIVVCGHTVQRKGVNDCGFKVCIDTGSFLDEGYITAMVIDGDETTYVNSK